MCAALLEERLRFASTESMLRSRPNRTGRPPRGPHGASPGERTCGSPSKTSADTGAPWPGLKSVVETSGRYSSNADWPGTMIRPKDIVNILQGGEGRVTILCGAGISVESGLPAVSTLLTCILEALEVDRDDMWLLRNQDGSWRMPFERFMEAFIEHDQDTTLFEIFRLGNPNRNHYLIKSLVEDGTLHEVCTTNFDTLIEDALDQDSSMAYNVITEEDGQTVVRSSLPIIKMHGTSSDIYTIKSTISSISSGAGYENRISLLKDVLRSSSSVLWVWGYSCSDELDINPVIREVSPINKTVIYVEHDESIKDIERAVVKPISDVEDDNPFKSCEGYIIKVDARQLVKEMTPELNGFVNEKVKQTDWKEIVRKWVSSFKSPHLKPSIACHLFWNLSEQKTALKYNDKIFKTPSTDKRGLGAAWSNRGMILIEKEHTKEALYCFRNALDLFRRINFPHGIATSYNHIGYSLSALGKQRIGLKYILIGLNYLSNHDYRMLELCKGHLLMSKGEILCEMEDYEDAIEIFEDSFSLFENNGHIPQASKVLKLMGKAYAHNNETKTAKSFLQEAYKRADKVGSVKVANEANKLITELENTHLQN